jgi:hypothetical protein
VNYNIIYVTMKYFLRSILYFDRYKILLRKIASASGAQNIIMKIFLICWDNEIHTYGSLDSFPVQKKLK